MSKGIHYLIYIFTRTNTLYTFYINIHVYDINIIYAIMMYNITNYIIVQFDLETFNYSHYNNTVYIILQYKRYEIEIYIIIYESPV